MSPEREAEARAIAILYFAHLGIPVCQTVAMPIEEIRVTFDYLRSPRKREPA
jgi:hypothetical protein